jgi:hypothetical protein
MREQMCPSSLAQDEKHQAGPLKADLHFDDRDGHHWRGTLVLEAVPSDAQQFVVRIATARADGNTKLHEDARSMLLPSRLQTPDLAVAHWPL